MRAFENWLTQEVEDTFGIEKVKDYQPMKDWLSADTSHIKIEGWLLQLQELVSENADYWNEDELKMQFIAPLLSFINFQTQYFKPFSQRRLRAEVNGIEIGGVVDYMVARGKQLPKHPYFFVHEYKQEAKRDTDPKGQLLVEMVAANAANADESLIYGCYVIGRFWFFVMFQGKNYAVSQAYDATKDEDLKGIVAILQKVKAIIISKFE
jgi:hypothetical protein